MTSALFFGSGFAALLYQIAWQRMLFGWYGVDLDSISVIVSIFMLAGPMLSNAQDSSECEHAFRDSF